MKIRLVLLLLLTHLAAFAAPDFTRFAFTLELKEQNGTTRHGTGCLVKSGNAIYYVTAHHLFPDLTDAQRADLVKKTSIISESNGQARFAPEEFIPVPNAVDLTRTDLMVFRMKPNPSLAAYAVPLAASAPAKDEPVYLAARIPGRLAATYALKVLRSDDNKMEYEKIPDVEKYTGASGGPIVNAKGQLVGTYLGRVLVKPGQPEIRCLFGTPLVTLLVILPPNK